MSCPCASCKNGGPQCRVSSPAPGRSTLTTSAPRSASIWVHQGPASTRDRSNTLMWGRAPWLGFSGHGVRPQFFHTVQVCARCSCCARSQFMPGRVCACRGGWGRGAHTAKRAEIAPQPHPPQRVRDGLVSAKKTADHLRAGWIFTGLGFSVCPAHPLEALRGVAGPPISARLAV